MGLGSLKSKASGKPLAKKASKTAVVTASDVVGDAIRDFHVAKKNEKQAKAEIADAEARMIDEAKELRVRHSRSEGENTPSVRLSATDSSGGRQTAMCTQKNQFRKMTGDHVDVLKASVGSVNFDKWFKGRTTYSFDEEALRALPNADEVADAIIAALGEHVDILKVETAIVPTTQYADETTLNEKSAAFAEKLESQGLAVPYKMSFK